MKVEEPQIPPLPSVITWSSAAMIVAGSVLYSMAFACALSMPLWAWRGDSGWALKFVLAMIFGDMLAEAGGKLFTLSTGSSEAKQ